MSFLITAVIASLKGFCGIGQALVEGAQVAIVPDGDQSWHVECLAQGCASACAGGPCRASFPIDG